LPWDLQLSHLGDLTFTGNRDLATLRQQAELIRQRGFIRLSLPRGSWVIDKDLGSELHTLLHETNTAAQQARGASIVSQALKAIDELTVEAVSVEPDRNNPRSVIVLIEGTVASVRRGFPATQAFATEITLPLAPAPSETTLRA
jgi:phage baseplate assembly protein W